MMGSVWIRGNRPDLIEDRLLTERMRELQDRVPRDELSVPARARAFAQNHRWGNRFAAGLGAHYAFFWQPLLDFKKHPAGSELKHRDGPIDSKLELRRQAYLAELNRFQGELNTHDLTDIFGDRREEIFTDYIHVQADKYNPEIAAAIGEKLIPLLNKKGPPNPLEGTLPEASFLF
jgi:hypothetical protein